MMLVSDALALVKAFHQTIGEHIADRPQLLRGSRPRAGELAAELLMLCERYASADRGPLPNRALLVLEEEAEWLRAHQQASLVEALDAAADRLCAVLGDAVATGLPIESAFRVVLASNLTKTAVGADGKAQKGPRYLNPRASLAALVGESL